MRNRRLAGCALAACLVLGGCSGSASDSAAPSPTQAAAASVGPGATDAQHCNVPYGNQPQVSAPPTSIAGTLGQVMDLLNQCVLNGAETLTWTDAQQETRKACLVTPPAATPQNRLPLVVFLQGSIFAAPPQLSATGWLGATRSADLSGDPQRPGFILLIPIGRNTTHLLPFPDDAGLGWDNWYRNLDRDTADLNLDVAAIDAFTAQVRARGIVDDNRVYMGGWSNGAAMAQLYALNTPSIAAAAVYSAPAPFSDVQDPCYQSPFATTPTPLMDIHNACDIGGICQTGTRFHQELAERYPQIPQRSVIVDSNKRQVEACNAACSSQNPLLTPAGLANHLLWPQSWNEAMFEWLREHPLEAKGR